MAGNIIKELEDLGKEIKKAERDVQTEEGKISAYKQSLKEEFDINTVEDAEVKLDELLKEKDVIDKTIDEKFLALKEGYDW